MQRKEIIQIGLVYVRSVFVDREWKVFSREDREKICESGWFYVNTSKPEGKFGCFVAQRQSADKDFALNLRGYQHMLERDRDQALAAGFIALTENFCDVLNVVHVEEVAHKLGDTAPRLGQYGRYFWIDRDFNPVRSQTTSAYVAQDDERF
jgi:hypothetical protein